MIEAKTEPVEIAGVEVEDVFVDFNMNCSNPPELFVSTDEDITPKAFTPVEGGEPDDTRWIVENGGVFGGWRESPPGASDETQRLQRAWEVEHAEYGVQNRYWEFEHVVKDEQNAREPLSVLSVCINESSSYPIRVELAQKLIDQYLNGPLGSDIISYWYWKQEDTAKSWWTMSVPDDSDFKGYVDPDSDIVLVHDSIYTWHPVREEDVGDRTVFETDTTFFATISGKSGRAKSAHTDKGTAQEECDKKVEKGFDYTVEEIRFETE